MVPCKIVDWEAIESEYRAGIVSIREIARKYGIDQSGLRRKAGKNGWTRDLAAKIKLEVSRKLVSNSVSTPNARDGDIVDAESDNLVRVQQLHRKDITRLQELEQAIMAELGDEKNPPTKIHICQFQGTVIETVVNIAVTERAAALNNLANVQHKRIALERQAYSLDEPGEGSTVVANYNVIYPEPPDEC